MNPIHLNSAEAIIEPFWDPDLSELDKWDFNNKKDVTVTFEQTWCMVLFKWANASPGNHIFTMTRDYDFIDVKKTDILTLSASMRKGLYFTITVEGKNSNAIGSFKCHSDKKQEFEVNIESLEVIEKVKITVGTDSGSDGSCWFNWIGIVNKSLLKEYLNTKNDFSEATWEKHLKPKTFKPTFKPTYGILISETELESIRLKPDETKASLLNFKNIKNFQEPEKYIGDYVNFLKDTRYNRQRDEDNSILTIGEKAAFAGIVNKDKKLLRLAARYALSIASCGRWDDGFICDFKTSFFNHRCFVQSLCLYECALILDIAGEMFTETGRNYILKKMAEEGIGTINYNTWSYEYIFHCNQMAWFSPGRMYGYAVLKEHWPRIQKYMKIALDDVVENIENTVEEDGGYVEGPTYFSCVGRDALLAIYIYSKSTGVPVETLIPEKLAKSVTFAEVTESRDKKMDFIPICDSGYKIKPSFRDKYKVHLAFMAYFYKDSVWPSIYQKHILNHGLGENPLTWILDEKIPSGDNYTRKSFIKMNKTGHISSLRKTTKDFAKLLVVGNKMGAGHTHCDKGSFVYEYNGESFLMDPGICSYDNPISWELKSPQRHNMLVPISENEIPYPKNPIMSDIIPDVNGNDIEVELITELTSGWEDWYEKWTRSITSITPESIIIEDDYQLIKGSGVEFILNTPFDIISSDGKVYIEGKTGRLEILIPEDCSYTIESLDHPVTTHNRIKIVNNKQKDILRVSLKMNPF